jgi:hypothetical protein
MVHHNLSLLAVRVGLRGARTWNKDPSYLKAAVPGCRLRSSWSCASYFSCFGAGSLMARMPSSNARPAARSTACATWKKADASEPAAITTTSVEMRAVEAC